MCCVERKKVGKKEENHQNENQTDTCTCISYGNINIIKTSAEQTNHQSPLPWPTQGQPLPWVQKGTCVPFTAQPGEETGTSPASPTSVLPVPGAHDQVLTPPPQHLPLFHLKTQACITGCSPAQSECQLVLRLQAPSGCSFTPSHQHESVQVSGAAVGAEGRPPSLVICPNFTP